MGTKNKVGLVILALLGLADVLSLAAVGGADDSAQNGPPDSVLIFCAVMGVVTLAATVPAWRGNRAALRVNALARVLSALSSLPAFFVDDVPAALVIVASTGILLTVLGIWLSVSRPAVLVRS